MSTILIVDDDAALRAALATTLSDLGHVPVQAADGAAALAWLANNRADAMLLDLRMPGIGGMEVLRRLRAQADRPAVAVLTAVPTSDNTIEAMRLGAADHIAKPLGREDLRALLDRILPVTATASAIDRSHVEGDLIGSSPAMRDVHKAIGLLADNDATVLLSGETGTGKEVVARAIHRHGKRAAAPFVAVNCAAIPGELLESLLFGHVRGAFTGAVADRPGSFREAHGGTLFLDEIGDMDLAMQAKLLRVLQERVVTPLGGRPMAIDVRVIAATHRDLRAAVSEGRFRQDLYYRLGVVPVVIPPLRERQGDVPVLAEIFLVEAGGTATQLSTDAVTRLIRYRWPGNVRELRNAMQRVAALVRRPVVVAADLGFLDSADGKQQDWMAGTLPEAVERLEIALIRRAMAETQGNRSQAAERLGIRRQLLYQKLARYGLDASDDGTATVPYADR